MKYYYSKNVGCIYDKVSFGLNVEKVKEDKNKMVIIYDQPIFHVMTYKNPIIEDEKKILDYAELVEYIKENNLNVYFFNTNRDVPTLVINDVNSRKKQTTVDLPSLEESIYTLNDNEIIKLTASVDREIIRDSIKEFFNREKSKDNFMERMNGTESRFKKVPFKDFISNPTLLDMYNLPLYVSNDDFVVPTYSYNHVNIFYILNGIYSKLGDKINLNEQNLKELYLLTNSEYKYIIDEIIKNIEVRVDNRYDLETFSSSIDYIDNVQKQEHDNSMQSLNRVKGILNAAKENQEFVHNLGLLNEEKQKQLEIKKPVTK